MVSTAELEVDNVVPLCSDLLRCKRLGGASCNGSDTSCAFTKRKPTRPLLAPTTTVMLAAETREGAKAATMATEEAAENFMVLNVNELGMD